MVQLQVSKWGVAIAMYLFVIMTLFAVRPALMFDASGNPKPVGLGLKDGYSFLGPAVGFPILAILCYFAAVWIHVVLI